MHQLGVLVRNSYTLTVVLTIALSASSFSQGKTLQTLMTVYPYDLSDIIPLGNFDTAANCKNAVGLYRGVDNDKTWYLRTPSDTVSSFTWIHGAPVFQGKFRGVGRDYISWRGTSVARI